MRFGLGPFAAEAAGSRGWTEAYETVSDAVVLAEHLGFDSAWVAERYFTRTGYTPSSFVVAAQLAARTESIRLGVIPVLGLTHPVYVAEDAATLDNVSGGRAIIAPIPAVVHEIEGYGLTVEGYAERFEESLDVLQLSWGARPFHHAGANWTIPAQLDGHTPNPSGTVTVTPKPVQFELPLWVGGFDATARQAAAARGLPLVLGAINDDAELDALWGRYESITTRASRVPRVLIRDVYVTSGADPLDESADSFARQFENYAEWGSWSGDTVDHRALAADHLIAGDPEQVIERIRALDEAHGLDHLICRMHFPGMSFAQLSASMGLFAREVIPEFEMPDLPAQIRKGV